jgi:arylsulfatase A
MLTGKSTIHCGVSRNNDDLPATEVTIAEALKARGYATALYGKWHHGMPPKGQPEAVHPLDQGFDEVFGFIDATHAHEKFPKYLWEGREKTSVSGYADDLFTDRAVDFLKRHKNGPFFLYLPYISAHFRIEAPADEVAKHKGKFAEADPSAPLHATYAAMVTRLDHHVGRVVAALDDLKLTESTLIVFASDHGATFEAGNRGTSRFHDSNRPFRGQKRTVWEGGVRVPAFAVWPGHIAAAKMSDEVMQTIDLMPTLLDAVGGKPEASWHVDGVDLLPSWTGAGKVPDRTIFWEWRTEGSDVSAAMRGNFKLVASAGNRPELFDVVADPAERRNAAAEFPEVAKRLELELKTWLASEVPAPVHP